MGEWRDRAGPWARATLPDGQQLDVIVTARERTSDGRWWFACEAILPTRYEHADRQREAKAAPTRITVAADAITPIPGEDYTTVPTAGAVAGRQWLAVRTRGVRDEAPQWYVHRKDCWQARGGWKRRLVTAEEALAVLADVGAARVCDICRPDRGLRA